MKRNGDDFRVGIISGSIWGSFRAWGSAGIISGTVQLLLIQSPVNAATFFGLLVTVTTGFHCRQIVASGRQTVIAACHKRGSELN